MQALALYYLLALALALVLLQALALYYLLASASVLVPLQVWVH